MSNNFRPGDKVRVTYEALWDQDRGSHYWLRDLTDGFTTSVLKTATVELIERADDPSKDPLGTVRRCGDGEIWVHVKRDPSETAWRCVGEDLFEGNHRHMAGTEVIGVVPGTSAAESNHEFEASFSGMVCGRMVMRDGGGDACGKTASEPVHRINP